MNRIRHIFSSALRCLPLVFAASLASCTAITDDVPADETATISLSITARQESDLNTRANYEVGQDHEFIHSLYVYIVSAADETVVKKYIPDLKENSAAMKGNLRSWTSDPLTLDAGTYTIYAFANLDTYYDRLSASLSGLQEGAQFSELNVDGIVFEDPASKIDFNKGCFIPMSAQKTVIVTPATTGISIGLDRLVSKIRMLGIAESTPVSSLTFGGYANKVGLFPETDLGDDVTYDREYDVVKAGKLGEGNKVEDFYVNCSPEGHKFTVTLGSTEHGGTVYHATTKRDVLPRNSIFPLMLQLDDFALDFTARCWLSPIGAEPTPVIVTLESKDTYSLRLPEGSQFELKLNGVNTDNTGATNVSCTWSFDKNTVSGLAFEGYQPGSTVVKGHVTASAGRTYPLTCEAQWTLNGTQYHRTYTVNVITDDIFNFDFDTSSNAAGNRFGLLWLNTEMLNMSRH